MVRLVGLVQTARFVGAGLRGEEMVRVRVPGVRNPLLCRTRGSDRWVLWEVFGRAHCEYALRRPPHLIIDGGANVGYVSVFLAQAYPDAKIVAVEPDLSNLALLRENCAPYPNIEVIPGAMWPERTELFIENPDELSWGLRVSEAQSSTDRLFPSVTVGDILARSGEDRIDLLKLDIEGSEERLFSRGYEGWIGRVGKLIVETHGPRSREAVLAATESRGFVRSWHGEHIVMEAAEDAP
jgi:FkbM family methyltransferase